MARGQYPRWTLERRERLARMQAEGKSSGQIAERLGVSQKMVLDEIERQRVRAAEAAKKENLRRRCLKCRNWFRSEQRNLFVCNQCKSGSDWKSGNSDVHGEGLI